MIDTILLDVDNTLLDFDKCASKAMEQGFAELDLSFDKSMFEVFTRINDSLWAELEQGLITRETLHRRRWNMVFEALHIVRDGEAFEKRFFALLSESCEPVEGAMALLEYLSAASYTLCAASNGPYEQQRLRLDRAGMLPFFKHLFISERIGFAKPSRHFFSACLRELGDVDPQNILLIGDSPSADIQGGAMFGIRTCWFNHDHRPYDGAFPPDFSVDSLDRLRFIL